MFVCEHQALVCQIAPGLWKRCLFTWTGVRCQDVMPDWLQSNSCAGVVQSTGATV